MCGKIRHCALICTFSGARLGFALINLPIKLHFTFNLQNESPENSKDSTGRMQEMVLYLGEMKTWLFTLWSLMQQDMLLKNMCFKTEEMAKK